MRAYVTGAARENLDANGHFRLPPATVEGPYPIISAEEADAIALAVIRTCHANPEAGLMYRLMLVVIIAAGSVVVHGCRDGSDQTVSDRWSGTIETLESGRLVVRNPDVALWRTEESWQLRERFRLGRLEGDGPDVFGEIRDIQLGRDGQLFILDSQAAEVRVFGPEGEYIRTFGRSGQGPGELSRPAGMALDSAGMLWIMNWGNARYSAFDPSTGQVAKEPRRLASFTAIPWPGQFDRTGRLLDIGLGSDGKPVILLLDTAFVPQDTLTLPQTGEEHRVLFRRGELPIMSALDPFAPQPAWAPHPGGGIVVGEGDSYRLHRIGFRGDTTMTVEVLRPPAPVSRPERDSALAAFRDISQMADGAEPDRRPRVAANKPAHGALFVDDQAYVWVRRTPESGSPPAWDVIADDGRLLGEVSIPLSSRFVALSVRGDRFAVGTSVEGVPTVVVFDLVRSIGAT